MRGRAFGFVALLCVTWATARIAINMIVDTHADGRQPHLKLQATNPQRPRAYTNNPSVNLALVETPLRKHASLVFPHRPHRPPSIPSFLNLEDNYGSANPMASAPGTVPVTTQAIAEVTAATLSVATSPSASAAAPRLINIYAYSFWRPGDAGPTQLGNGQYGGSQSAVIATVPLLRYRNAPSVSRLAIIGRLSTSHSKFRESEGAAGVRWQPARSVPAQISIERRFRQNGPDVVAVYVAGGLESAKQPLGFLLDGYGQAGVTTGQEGGIFGDIHATAQRRIVGGQRATLTAGGGVWGGGQDRVRRVDVGPSVRAVVPVGPAAFRIDASWRFRVAGKVQPGSGPAVTLSTSF